MRRTRTRFFVALASFCLFLCANALSHYSQPERSKEEYLAEEHDSFPFASACLQFPEKEKKECLAKVADTIARIRAIKETTLRLQQMMRMPL
jgi:hypothetical protein